MDILKYNTNDREHVNAADTLGSLQRSVDKGTVADEPHSYYLGIELKDVVKEPNTEYRKRDAVANSNSGKKGGNSNNRTQNRVIIVRNTVSGALVEDVAYFWRHDSRVYQLGSGFFERAKMYRSM